LECSPRDRSKNIIEELHNRKNIDISKSVLKKFMREYNIKLKRTIKSDIKKDYPFKNFMSKFVIRKICQLIRDN